MGLEVKVKVINGSNTPIDYGPRCRVSKVICLVCFRWVKAGVMPLPDNDDRDFGSVFPKTCACRTNQRKFVLDHRVELSCSCRIIRIAILHFVLEGG